MCRGVPGKITTSGQKSIPAAKKHRPQVFSSDENSVLGVHCVPVGWPPCHTAVASKTMPAMMEAPPAIMPNERSSK